MHLPHAEKDNRFEKYQNGLESGSGDTGAENHHSDAQPCIQTGKHIRRNTMLRSDFCKRKLEFMYRGEAYKIKRN